MTQPSQTLTKIMSSYFYSVGDPYPDTRAEGLAELLADAGYVVIPRDEIEVHCDCGKSYIGGQIVTKGWDLDANSARCPSCWAALDDDGSGHGEDCPVLLDALTRKGN